MIFSSSTLFDKEPKMVVNYRTGIHLKNTLKNLIINKSIRMHLKTATKNTAINYDCVNIHI